MTINVFGGGNTGGPAFPLQRSVRLRSSASAYFNRTPASSTNQTTWTWSGWVKRGTLGSGVNGTLFYAGANSTYWFGFRFNADVLNVIATNSGGSTIIDVSTPAVFRDISAWYHIVLKIDTTQATASNRVIIYVNGVQQTLTITTQISQNQVTSVNTNVIHTLGRLNYATTNYFDGYLTEVNFIDGQALTPTSFGSINSSTGVWQPIKYSGTYGTNGFYLNFQDNSGATATTIGKDSSGNGNNWTPNNISVTAGVTYDSMVDVPTLTSNTNANFCVLNSLAKNTSATIADGNLKESSGAVWAGDYGSIEIPTSGKWYFEVTNGVLTASLVGASIGLCTSSSTLAQANVGDYLISATASLALFNNSASSSATAAGTWAASDIIQVAADSDNGKIWIGRNNVWYNSTLGTTGDPATNTNATLAVSPAGLFPRVSTFSNNVNANFGQRPFTYTPPTGFKSLNTYNLPAPTIPNGATQFAATTYTGTGSSLAISNTVNGKSFQPDLVWVKGRSGATDHALYDSVRGTTKQLESNTTTAETTEATGLTAFDTGGFTVGALAQMNTNTATYVGWQWKASNAAPVTNTSGSISSQVSANPGAGFSIVTYTGTGANATVGHGLGIAPKMVIVKLRSGVQDWIIWQTALAGTEYLLFTTAAKATAATFWNSTTPTSSVFSIGASGATNTSSGTYVAYCFSEIAGYSKFGSYTGNGSTDGVFVYTGFRPKWVLVKSSSAVEGWVIWDSSRNTYNTMPNVLYPNLSNAEGGSTNIDFLSNGFKLRNSATNGNITGVTYIYAAFAESPFNYSLAR